MKIILLQDVPKIGQKYDIKYVKDGFAQNFLFPKKLAITATVYIIQEIEKKKEAGRIIIEKQEKLLIENIAKLKGVTLILKGKATPSGGLFSSVGKDKIVFELKKQHDIEIGEDNIELEKPLKEIGEHEVTVVMKDKKEILKLVIEGEE